MILRNPRGRSKTRPTEKKTLDTRHMVKIQAGRSPEAEHFGKLRQTHVFRTRVTDGVLTEFFKLIRKTLMGILQINKNTRWKIEL